VLLALGLMVGVVTGLLGCLILHHPSLLSKDAILAPILKSIAPYIIGPCLYLGCVVPLDGIQMVLEDIPFLAKGQVVLVVLLLLYVRFDPGSGILAAWLGINAFNLIRLIVSSVRVSFLWQKPRRKA